MFVAYYYRPWMGREKWGSHYTCLHFRHQLYVSHYWFLCRRGVRKKRKKEHEVNDQKVLVLWKDLSVWLQFMLQQWQNWYFIKSKGFHLILLRSLPRTIASRMSTKCLISNFLSIFYQQHTKKEMWWSKWWGLSILNWNSIVMPSKWHFFFFLCEMISLVVPLLGYYNIEAQEDFFWKGRKREIGNFSCFLILTMKR